MDVTKLASRLSRADFAPGETLNLIVIKVKSTQVHAKPWVRKQHSPYEEEKRIV